jgi:hypothetical protein
MAETWEHKKVAQKALTEAVRNLRKAIHHARIASPDASEVLLPLQSAERNAAEALVTLTRMRTV